VASDRAKKDLDALNGRFISAMEGIGYTGYSLSKVLGTSEAVISNIRTRKNPPNIMLLRELLNKHLELDPEWLLFGRGQMLRNVGVVAKKATGAPETGSEGNSLEGRLARMEKLLERALYVQLERTVDEDESQEGLSGRITALEEHLASLRKARDKSPSPRR
jgi:transcriptional regulator with XRE-family HTH domain